MLIQSMVWICLRLLSAWDSWQLNLPSGPLIEIPGPPTREEVLLSISMTHDIIANDNLSEEAQKYLCETLISNNAHPELFQAELTAEEIYDILFVKGKEQGEIVVEPEE
ncbi:hypothetical protein [Gimesia panareensis]|nr:hypothetical protein [Gimesia panareensis]